MAEYGKELTNLCEMKRDVSRALVDIWRGARLVRDGVDVTDAQRVHLQAVIAEIDTKIAACDDEFQQATRTPGGTPRPVREASPESPEELCGADRRQDAKVI